MDITTDLLAQINHHLWAAQDGLAKGNLERVRLQLERARYKLPRVDFLVNTPNPWSMGQGVASFSVAAMLADGLTVNKSYQGEVFVTVDPISTGPVPLQLYSATHAPVISLTGWLGGRWSGYIMLRPNLIGIYPPVLRVHLKDSDEDLAGDVFTQWVA